MRWRGAMIATMALAGAALWTAAAPASPDLIEQQRTLAEARRASAEAAARATELEVSAAGERNAAGAAASSAAATQARIREAEGNIAAAEARIAIIDQLLGQQHTNLAEQQGPIVRLVAALQSLARRPVAISLLQPGSVDDLIHVRAVLAGALPAIRARTAGLRAQLESSRQLRDVGLANRQALAQARTTLERQRLDLLDAEASHRARATAIGQEALGESDRSLALGEQARDLVDQAAAGADADRVLAGLRNLPGPLPRPDPKDADRTMIAWSPEAPPYRLPVAGRVLTGLGEVSDAGVRSRGLTIACAPQAAVIAPAAGRVIFAAPFRSYGMVVIIDHGGGWTTLLSGLGAVAVQVGVRVPQGATVGRAGAAMPRVTAELRRAGRAVDMVPLIG